MSVLRAVWGQTGTVTVGGRPGVGRAVLPPALTALELQLCKLQVLEASHLQPAQIT